MIARVVGVGFLIVAAFLLVAGLIFCIGMLLDAILDSDHPILGCLGFISLLVSIGLMLVYVSA